MSGVDEATRDEVAKALAATYDPEFGSASYTAMADALMPLLAGKIKAARAEVWALARESVAREQRRCYQAGEDRAARGVEYALRALGRAEAS